MRDLDFEQALFPNGITALETNLRFFRRLEKAWKLVHSDYSNEDLTTGSVSREIGMSKSHFSAVFKRTTGRTFYDYLVRVRLHKSILIMKERNRSIWEITFLSGFSSQRSFERSFKRLLGISPKSAQKQLVEEILAQGRIPASVDESPEQNLPPFRLGSLSQKAALEDSL